jgi:hypothetical protein
MCRAHKGLIGALKRPESPSRRVASRSFQPSRQVASRGCATLRDSANPDDDWILPLAGSVSLADQTRGSTGRARWGLTQWGAYGRAAAFYRGCQVRGLGRANRLLRVFMMMDIRSDASGAWVGCQRNVCARAGLDGAPARTCCTGGGTGAVRTRSSSAPHGSSLRSLLERGKVATRSSSRLLTPLLTASYWREGG